MVIQRKEIDVSNQGPFESPEESDRTGTVLEFVSELREQIRRVRTVSESAGNPGVKEQEDDTLLFRPTHRPTMVVLYVLDDGSQESEIIRIRGETFVIGRSAGDFDHRTTRLFRVSTSKSRVGSRTGIPVGT